MNPERVMKMCQEQGLTLVPDVGIYDNDGTLLYRQTNIDENAMWYRWGLPDVINPEHPELPVLLVERGPHNNRTDWGEVAAFTTAAPVGPEDECATTHANEKGVDLRKLAAEFRRNWME